MQKWLNIELLFGTETPGEPRHTELGEALDLHKVRGFDVDLHFYFGILLLIAVNAKL